MPAKRRARATTNGTIAHTRLVKNEIGFPLPNPQKGAGERDRQNVAHSGNSF